MPLVVRSVCVLAHDSFFGRAGATVYPPAALSGWPAAALTDESDALAWRPAAPVAAAYVTVDLGAGNEDAPDYLAAFGNTAAKQGVTGRVEFGPDGATWTLAGNFAWGERSMLITADTFGALAAARWWRVGFVGVTSTALRCSELLFGRRVEIRGAEWLGFDPTDERLDRPTVRTEAGHLERSRFLGATRRARVVVPLASRARVEDQDPAVGLAYWWDHVARAGRPTAFAFAAGLPGEHYRDAFYAHVVDASWPLATTRREGQRAVSLTLEGARPWARA